jgi:hypothetical protein
MNTARLASDWRKWRRGLEKELAEAATLPAFPRWIISADPVRKTYSRKFSCGRIDMKPITKFYPDGSLISSDKGIHFREEKETWMKKQCFVISVNKPQKGRGVSK